MVKMSLMLDAGCSILVRVSRLQLKGVFERRII